MTRNIKSKMPEITCLGVECRKIIKLPSYIDPQDYDGHLRCRECKSLMRIKLEGSEVVKYSRISDNSSEAKAFKLFRELNELRMRND